MTEEEETQLINRLSFEVKKRGMETPAILFLEMHKPIAGIAGSALIVFSPFVAPFVGMNNVHDLSRLLGKPSSYEKLIVAIESQSPENALGA